MIDNTIDKFISEYNELAREDSKITGAKDKISQITWMLYLKVIEQKVKNDSRLAEATKTSRKYILPERFYFSNIIKDDYVGESLITFVNDDLFKNIADEVNGTETFKEMTRFVFRATGNHISNSVILKKIFNLVNSLNVSSAKGLHTFNEIYESLLQNMQDGKDLGEFYTPRPITNSIVLAAKPNSKMKILDFACGTGGFLVDALEYIKKSEKVDLDKIEENIEGWELKDFSGALAATNLTLHDISKPNIKFNRDSLSMMPEIENGNLKYDLVITNPPYGKFNKNESTATLNLFKKQFQTLEKSLLFVSMVPKLLKDGGEAFIVLPESFLTDTTEPGTAIKKYLYETGSIQGIISLPAGIFAPYTTIKTIIIKYKKGNSTPKETTLYQMDLNRTLGKTKRITNNEAKVIFETFSGKNKNVKKVNLNDIENVDFNFKLLFNVEKADESISIDVFKEKVSQIIDLLKEINNDF